MKKYILSIPFVCTLILLHTGCQNDGFYYQDEARVRIEAPKVWSLGSDSVSFSFVTQPGDASAFQLPVSIYIMGETIDRDREVKIAVDATQTTAQSKHYSLPASIVIPANEDVVIFPLTLQRTDDLQQNTVRLVLRLEESADFKIGVKEQSRLIVKWNDILSKPNNWNRLEEFFGTFSITKYRFMLNTIGVTEFDPDTMSWALLTNYKIILREALDAYNAANPGNPLRDENGQFVTF